MPNEKLSPPPEIYQIKVTLLGSEPAIWRRLLVPPAITLEQLHQVLQAAMGWDDGHLHEFGQGRRRFGQPDSDTDFLGGPATENERKVRVSDLLRRVGAKFTYLYDFGDGWEHSITLEKRLPADPNTALPLCIAGARASPPEDCGGISGFYGLLEALSDPAHEDHEEMLEWAGEFDPEAFSVESANQVLAPLQGWRSKAAKG